MKRLYAVAVGLLVIGSAAVWHSQQASSQANAGWVALFDGKTLDHFSPIGDANWQVVDGVIQADKGKGFLVSKDTYGDFQIRAEFYVDAGTNSGIFIRCTDPQNVGSKTAYEVNIWDTRPDPTYATGAIVDVAKPAQVVKAGGQWNTYEITAQGPKFTVTLNGIRTVDGAQDSQHASGRISLQYFGGGILKFRKVEVKRL